MIFVGAVVLAAALLLQFMMGHGMVDEVVGWVLTCIVLILVFIAGYIVGTVL